MQQKNLDLMKLLHKYKFNWNILQELNQYRSLWLDLCMTGTVDCMQFLFNHCCNWIDIKQFGIYNYREYDGLNWAVMMKNEKMIEYLLTNVYTGDNEYLHNDIST